MDSFQDSGTLSSNRYYRPDGTVPAGGLVYGLLYGAVAAVVLGFVYGYLVQYNPFVYFNALATFGFGFALGFATWLGAKKGHLRSPGGAAVLGAVVGCLGLYVGWVAWLRALIGRSDESFWVIDPAAVWELIGLVNTDGVWTLMSWTPTGGALWAIWGVEALVIVGLSAVACRGGAASTPYCRRCSTWAEEVFSGVKVGPTNDPAALRSSLEGGEMAALSGLGSPDEAQLGDHTEIELSVCPQCGDVGFLNLTSVAVTIDKKGKEEKDKNEILENLILDGRGIAAARDIQGAS